jgi:putative membrane protein
MKKLTTILFATAVAAMMPQMVNADNVDRRDADFIRKAAEGNIEEIQTAHIALQRTQDAQIRAFADKLANDHGNANSQLRQIANAKGVEVQTTLSSANDRENRRLLDKAPGKFDHEIVEHWVKDHKKDIKEYETAARKSKDPQVKQYATSQLPILREHLTRAEALNSRKTMHESAGAQPYHSDSLSP